MKLTAYDFKEFYASPVGQAVQTAIADRLNRLWPDRKGRRVLVYGYGLPYGTALLESDRVVFLMPPEQGAYPWPEEGKNLVALSTRTALPLESNSLDGVILIHALEYTNAVDLHLEEIWRILKSNGRLIAVVPNRIGFWSRADWTPFGQGMPFTLSQLHRHLKDTLFVPERRCNALFFLPLQSRLLLRLAGLLEKYGSYIYPALAGVHIVEASKQVYAGLALPVRARQKIPASDVLVPQANTREMP